LEVVAQTLASRGDAGNGDRIVLTGGIPVGGGGKTNFIKIHKI